MFIRFIQNQCKEVEVTDSRIIIENDSVAQKHHIILTWN